MTETYCVECGTRLPSAAKFCWQCGQAVVWREDPAGDGAGAAGEGLGNGAVRRLAPAARSARRVGAGLATQAGRATVAAAAGAAQGAAAATREGWLLGEQARAARAPSGSLAGLAPRLLGRLIDTVIVVSGAVGVAATAAAVVALVAWLGDITVSVDGVVVLVAGLLLVGFASLYEPGFLAAYGRTPGGLTAGLEVRRLDGSPVGFGRAYLRQWARILSMVPLGLGVLWVAWDPRRQAWHDHLTGTVVVVERSRQWRRVHDADNSEPAAAPTPAVDAAE